MKQHPPPFEVTDFSSEGPELVLKKLRSALQADGDFPVRARVVSELRALTNDPNTPVHRITDLILREPSLGTRVLHLVNSAFYHHAQPIMTITQAVIQIGMRPLADLCAGLILMQRFVPTAKRGGIFAENLKKSIITALLTSDLVAENNERGHAQQGYSERGYLAATFFNLGNLLLGYYFPQAYETAAKRAATNHLSLTQSLTEIIGIDQLDLNLVVVEGLDIPQYYRDILIEAHRPYQDRSQSGPNSMLASAIAAANELASLILTHTSAAQLMVSLKKLSTTSGYELEDLRFLVEDLPYQFREHCKLVEMGFLTLPDYLESEAFTDEEATNTELSFEEKFHSYIKEIRQEIDDQQPMSSIISSVMETLAFGLEFERVVLLLSDISHQSLCGKMALGNGIDPKQIWRKLLGNETACDIAAFQNSSLTTSGEPIFPDGSPCAALPIGVSSTTVGVIYADCINKQDLGLTRQKEHALQMLVELLDQALVGS